MKGNCHAPFDIRIWENFATIFLKMKNLKMLIRQHLFIPHFGSRSCIHQKSSRMNKFNIFRNFIRFINKLIINWGRKSFIIPTRFILIRRVSDYGKEFFHYPFSFDFKEL